VHQADEAAELFVVGLSAGAAAVAFDVSVMSMAVSRCTGSSRHFFGHDARGVQSGKMIFNSASTGGPSRAASAEEMLPPGYGASPLAPLP